MAYELEQAEFADTNPEPRCPVVLLLDTSYSMSNDPIDELNGGVRAFETSLKSDKLAAQRVEVAVVTFGGNVTALDGRTGHGSTAFDAQQAFVLVDEFTAPHLSASGDTPMGEAMRRALQLIRDRKDFYKSKDLDYYRPWIVLITDGQPTDDGWESAADEARREEERHGVIIFPIGVGGANMAQLGRFSTRQPLLLHGLNFKELFSWLSRSLQEVPRSKPGDQIPLPPVGWGTVAS